MVGLGLLKAATAPPQKPLQLTTDLFNDAIGAPSGASSPNLTPYGYGGGNRTAKQDPFLPQNAKQWASYIQAGTSQVYDATSAVPQYANAANYTEPAGCNLTFNPLVGIPSTFFYGFDPEYSNARTWAMSEWLLRTKKQPANGASRFGAVWLERLDRDGQFQSLEGVREQGSDLEDGLAPMWVDAAKSGELGGEWTMAEDAASFAYGAAAAREFALETDADAASSDASARAVSAAPVAPRTGVAHLTVFSNTTASAGYPTYLSLANDALLRFFTGAPAGASSPSIRVSSKPLPLTEAESSRNSSIGSFVAVLFFTIAFSFIPASFAVFVVKEREINAKHQQLISGVSIPAYWLSTFVFDSLTYVIPGGLAVVLVVVFGVQDLIRGESLAATIVLIALYGVSVAAFTYCVSYAFGSHSTAQIVVLVLNLCCMLLLIASFVMQQIESTCKADRVLRFVYRVLPGYAMGNGLMQLSLLKSLNFFDTNCGELTPAQMMDRKFTAFSMEVSGWPILYMCIETVVYFLLAIGIDLLLSFPAIKAWLLPDKDIPVDDADADEDVREEVRRVERGAASSDLLVLKGLRKIYGGAKAAVRNLTFGVPKSQVFGLLGINGAGKSTAFKMLSGDIVPTSGTATISGHDVLREQIECRRLIGYCPQFDAILDLLSVREHLEMYARIKGVPTDQLEQVVQAKMQQMDLPKFEHKLAGTLSGGNKRKLSVGIALIGNPSLVLLDEPSTGVDPVARRKMWDIITQVATERKTCSVVLTTHSMEECQALAQRVGIQVGGRLRCLGSIQHLKHRFGRGYTAEIKLDPAETDHIARVKSFMSNFISIEEGSSVVTSAALEPLCDYLGDPSRFKMIHPNGSGWAIGSELQSRGRCDAHTFAEWWAFESLGAALHEFILATFEGATLVERHGEHFRYSLPE